MKSPITTYTAGVITLVCIFAVVTATGCGPSPKQTAPPEAARPMKTIDEVIRLYSDSLMTIPGVVGLYHGLDDKGQSCLKVMVKQKTPELEQKIPKQIEGYAVVLDETGEIKPLH